jgi:lantibiotic transport system permease protein
MVALVFLAPLALAFLELAVGFQYGKKMYKVGGDSWMTLIDHTSMMWLLLLLPLFVTLQMGLMGALEHNNRTWKQLYTRPLPRWSIYIAKQIIGTGLIGLSTVVLGLMSVGVGLIGRVFLPELGFNAPIPWNTLFQFMFYPFLASWLIISIHLFVSLYLSSFVAAMGVGIVATVFGVVVYGSDFEQFDPWTIPGVVEGSLRNADPFFLPLIIGLIGGLIVACLGCYLTTRRDVLQ